MARVPRLVVPLLLLAAMAGCGPAARHTATAPSRSGEPAPPVVSTAPAGSPSPAPSVAATGASGIAGTTVAATRCPVAREGDCPEVPVEGGFLVLDAATGAVVAS